MRQLLFTPGLLIPGITRSTSYVICKDSAKQNRGALHSNTIKNLKMAECETQPRAMRDCTSHVPVKLALVACYPQSPITTLELAKLREAEYWAQSKGSV